MRKKRKYKNPLQEYSNRITVGVNNSTRNQLKKISKVDTKKPIKQVPLVDLYMYVDGAWIYKGVSCGLCQILMNNETVINKHRYVCVALNRVAKEQKNAD